MSTTIDNKVVEMKFDNAQFERATRESMSTLDKLRQKLSFIGATKGLENISDAAKKVDMNGLGAGIETVKAKFSAMQVVGITALANITNSVIRTGKRMMSALTVDPVKTGFQEYETKINAVQTILSNTSNKGKTIADVTKVLDELNLYADKTIYNFAEMTRNIGTFTAAGVGLEESASAIQGIANLAAASGSSSMQASTAMYQLSQALAAGRVNLQDWNSVVNAGMGGQKFQEALKATAREHNIAVDSIIKKQGSFRESLKEGWISADILNETLSKFTVDGAKKYANAMMKSGKWTKKQADALIKEAQSMEDAATKVKTFTQLWDTLKESAQSGWTETWELIVGDFEEAKAFLTELSDKFGAIIGESANARNELVRGALTSKWEQLNKKINDAGVSTETFRKKLQEIAKRHNPVVAKMVNDQESLSDSIKSGKIPVELITKTLQEFGKSSSKSAKAMRDLADQADKTGSPINNLVNSLSKPNGRELLIDSLRNSINAVIKVVSIFKSSWSSVFPPTTSDQLYHIIECLHDFSEKLKMSDTTAENLKRTLKGIFSILDIGKQLIVAVVKPIGKYLGRDSVSSFASSLLSLTASMGDFFVKLNSGIKAGNTFSVIGDIVTRALNGISDAISSVSNGVDGFRKTLSKIGNFISNVFGKIASIVGKGIKLISDNISFGDIFAGLAGGGIFILAKKLSGFVDSVKDAFDNLFDKKTVKKASIFSDVLESLHDSLSAFGEGIKVASIVGIAVAVTLLSSSLKKISEIEPAKIAYSLVAIGVMIAMLNKAFESMTKSLFWFEGKRIVKAGIAMMAMSEAINILADAMKKISDLSMEKILKGLAGIGGALFALTLATKQVSKGGVTLRTSIAILVFAESCKILCDAFSGFAQMSWGEIKRGLSAMGGALGEFVIAMTIMKKFGGGSITGATSILIASKALDEISENLKRLGELSWNEIKRGLSAMGGALGEFAISLSILSRAGGFGSLLGGTGLLIASKSLDTISENLERLGFMSWGEIKRGLSAMGGALGEFLFSLGALSKVGGFGSILGGTSILIAVQSLDEISENLKRLSSMAWDEIGRGLSAMGGALLEIGFVSGALGKIAGLSGIIGGGAILIVTQGLDDIANAFQKFAKMSWDGIDKGVVALGDALAEIGFVSGTLGKISGFSSLIGSGSILLVIQGLDELANALKKFGSMAWDEIGRGLSAMGGALLELGATVGLLGSLAGPLGLVGSGSLLLGIQGLDELANALKKFGSMNWDEIGRGFVAMASALGATALGGFLNTLSGLGAFSISIMAKPLGDLADSIKKWKDVTIPSGLGFQLGVLADGIMKFTFGGLGASAISTVAQPLGILADSVKKWASVVVPDNLGVKLGILADGVKKFTLGGLGAGALAKAVPGVGSMADAIKKWSGVTVPENLEKNLKGLADGVKAFSFAFLGGWSLDSINGPLGSLAGSVKKWNGISIPDNIKKNLKGLADGVKAFSFAFLGGWSLGAITKPLGSLAGSVKKWNGVEVPKNLASGLKGLASGVKSFGEAGMNSNMISSASSAISKLVTAINKAGTVNVSGVTSFVNSAKKLGNLKIDTSGITSSTPSVMAAIDKIVKTLSSKLKSGKPSVDAAMKSALSGLQSTIRSKTNDIISAMTTLIKTLTNSISSKKNTVTNSCKALVSGAASGIKSYRSSFISAGKYLGDGLIIGINAKKKAAYDAGYALGRQAVLGEKRGQQSNSPSKATIKAGKWLGEGLIIGMEKFGSKVYNTGRELGSSAVESMSGAISRANDLINGDMAPQPTIRPVLDLSNIRDGVGSINGLFGFQPSVGVKANIAAISNSMNNRQNGGNSDVISAIRDLKKSIGNIAGNTYNVNGVTYDDGSNISEAVSSLIRAAKIERRV